MATDKSTISKLEALALLKLSEQEKKGLSKDLEELIVMIDILQDVNTDEVEPLVNPNEKSKHSLRADTVKNELTQGEALQNAKKKSAPYFSVPKVINKES